MKENREALATLCVVWRQSNDHNPSGGRGQGKVSLSRLAEPGRGGGGTPHLPHEAGEDGATGRVLQTLLSHVGEDGLHVKLSHEVLHRRAGSLPSPPVTDKPTHAKPQ